jgi:hypothetical protein
VVRSVPRAFVAAVVTVNLTGEFRSGSDRRMSITPVAGDGLGWLGASMILVVDLPGVCPMLSIGQTTRPEMITMRYATVDFRRYFGNNRDRGDDRSSAVRPVRPGNLGRIHAADLSSLFSPRATILIASSGNGR